MPVSIYPNRERCNPGRLFPRVLLIIVIGTQGVIVNTAVLVAIPPGVVTTMLPVCGPVGKVAVICVSESTLKLAALRFPINTLFAPLKLLPVITTLLPAGPLEGEKLKITGATPNVLENVPPGVTTCTVPVVAPAGTVAVISELDTIV